MATVTPTVEDIAGDGSVRKITWTLTSANNDGALVKMAQWADRSVTFQGTWGTATAGIEGSNDGGTTYIALADPQGNPISKTADSVEAVLELTELMRPRLTTPGSGATVKVVMLCRRIQPLRT